MKDLTDGKLAKALEFAESKKDNSLQSCLDRLDYPIWGVEASLYEDFAPYSFYFVRYDSEGKFRGNGGVIYHGSHDNGGDGSAPTFSVNLTPVMGWAIHT